MESLKNYNGRFYFLLICIAITLPYPIKYNNLFIILLFINWLISRKFSIKVAPAYLLTVFYLLHVVGVMYSSNTSQALFELEKKISILLFPFIFTNSAILDKKQSKNILLSFVFACLVALSICLGYAVYQVIFHGTTEYFFYHSLTEIIGIHAIYMAMYISLSIFILIYFYGNVFMEGNKLHTTLLILILSYSTLFLFLLSARMVIIAFILIITTGLIYYGYRTKKLLILSALMMLIIFIFGLMTLFIPSNLERFKEAINYKSEYTIDKQYGGRSTRELIWSCGFDVIKENTLFGVGTGDAQDELQECYKRDEDKNWALLYRPDFEYNAHSQYLQTFIDLGILGVLVLLTILVVPAIIAIKYNDCLLMSFVALFSLACITESMLELNKGIVFFSFFISIFLNRYSYGQIVRH